MLDLVQALQIGTLTAESHHLGSDGRIRALLAEAPGSRQKGLDPDVHQMKLLSVLMLLLSTRGLPAQSLVATHMGKQQGHPLVGREELEAGRRRVDPASMAHAGS